VWLAWAPALSQWFNLFDTGLVVYAKLTNLWPAGVLGCIGIQHVPKQSMKRSAHRDIINETTTQLDSGISATMLKLDTTLGTLGNQSVGWLVNAYHDINNKDLILKAPYLLEFNSYLTLSPNRPSRCVVLVNLTSRKLA
jgi:hypothetical protein